MAKAVTRPRRSGTENRKRSTPVTSRYDDDELRALDEAASRTGLTRAGYQRTQSLSVSKTRSTRRPPVEKEQLARILGQIGKAGSNLNQIARAVNMSQAVAEFPDEELTLTLAELRRAAREIIGMLGQHHGD